jgi:hypothetical protein
MMTLNLWPKMVSSHPEIPHAGPARSSRGVAATLNAIVGGQDHPQQATGWQQPRPNPIVGGLSHPRGFQWVPRHSWNECILNLFYFFFFKFSMNEIKGFFFFGKCCLSLMNNYYSHVLERNSYS